MLTLFLIIIFIGVKILLCKGILKKEVDSYECKYTDNERELHRVKYISKNGSEDIYPYGSCRDKWGNWRCESCLHLEKINYKLILNKVK